MEAIYFNQYGGPEVLQLGQLEEPHAAPGQVRIAVRAAGVNPRDSFVRNGHAAEQFPTSFPATPGTETAGVVDEIGEGVTGVAVGDEVLGLAVGGSYAEYTLSAAFAPKPAQLSWAQAAALPIAAITSRRDLDLLAVTFGDTLLIHGAAGGVGTIAVQLAVARGATVIGTASQANHDFLRSLGATPVTYGEGLVERVRAIAPQGIDAVYDIAGKGALEDSIELRRGTERILTISDFNAASLGVTMSASFPENAAQNLAELAQQVAADVVRVEIAEELTLSESAAAMRLSETGHSRGKIVLHR